MNTKKVANQINTSSAPFSKPNRLADYMPSYEYRSKTSIFGFPLIHITRGIDPDTGRLRVACGWIAVGDIAVGGIALGGLTCGLLSLGGVSLGLFSLSGLAVGMMAAGGLAVAIWNAFGVIAVSWHAAVGLLTKIL